MTDNYVAWEKFPKGYKALLAIGRTVPLQPPVDLDELVALEDEHPLLDLRSVRPSLSVSQRLDLIATRIIADSEGERKMEHYGPILSAWKAANRASHEYLCPDPDIFSGFDPFVDRGKRSMEVKVEHFWAAGVRA